MQRNSSLQNVTGNYLPHTPDEEETRPGDCAQLYQLSGSGYRPVHLVFTNAPHSTYDTKGMRLTQLFRRSPKYLQSKRRCDGPMLQVNALHSIALSLGLFVLGFDIRYILSSTS